SDGRLALEASVKRRIVRQLWGDYLQRNASLGMTLTSAVNDPHPTATNELLDHEPAQLTWKPEGANAGGLVHFAAHRQICTGCRGRQRRACGLRRPRRRPSLIKPHNGAVHA